MTDDEPVPTRAWRHRLALGALALLSLLFVGSGVAVGYVATVLARIDRVEAGVDAVGADGPVTADALRGSSDEPLTGASADETAETLPPLGAAGPPRNFLLIGSDDVTGIGADEAILTEREEESGNSLADVIMVLRLDPSTEQASVLSVPRDLWVEIQADEPFDFKINTAFNLPDADARAERTVATVRDALGIEIHHFVHVNWAGFRSLVDILGGVEVCFDEPRRDIGTGLSVASAGPVELDGDAALAYVRSRKMEAFEDGAWVGLDDRADLDRIDRQQWFLQEVLDESAELRRVTAIRQIQRLVESGLDNVEIDNRLALGDVVDLARRFQSVVGDDLRTYSLEVADSVETFRGQELFAVRLLDSEANQLALDVFRGIEPGDVVPGRVDVELVAEEPDALEDLRALGFEVEPAPGEPGVETVVAYGPGGEDAALLVAAAVDGPVVYRPEPERARTSVRLELGTGAEIRDRLVAPEDEPPVAPAPTTVPPATTPLDTSPPPTTPVTETAPPTTVAPAGCPDPAP